MSGTDSGGRHAASTRRRDAKLRQKERELAKATERELEKTAEREAKKLDKQKKHAKQPEPKAKRVKEPKAKRAKQPEPSGWVAALTAIGIVVILIIISAVAYQALIASRPPTVPAKSSSALKDSAAAAPSGKDRPVAIASLGPLAAAIDAPREPLPGNPELSGRLFVVAGGDVMMDRRVSELIESEGGKAPLEDVASILKRGDFTILNLETPLSTRGEAGAKDVTFRGNPDGIAALVAAGVDAVTLANNHALDYGDVALADTIDLLGENKIAHTGAGANAKKAWAPAIVTTRGKRVAYLGWSYIEPGGFVAGDDSPGIAGAKGDPNEIAAAIKAAKTQADFVIVSFHWGVEYTDYPIDGQKELAHTAVDAGADLVASHHPHVIQGIEMYKDRLIAYSLGDFVFDHYSRKTGEAFILEATIGRTKTISARAIPVYLSEMGKPQVVTGEDADAILDRLKEISDGFGTKMSIANDVATIQVTK